MDFLYYGLFHRLFSSVNECIFVPRFGGGREGSGSDDMSEVFYLLPEEGIVTHFDSNKSFYECSEHLINVQNVFFNCF